MENSEKKRRRGGEGHRSRVNLLVVLKSEALKPRLAYAAGAYPGFRSMKRLGVFLLPRDGMLVHRHRSKLHLNGLNTCH